MELYGVENRIVGAVKLLNLDHDRRHQWQVQLYELKRVGIPRKQADGVAHPAENCAVRHRHQRALLRLALREDHIVVLAIRRDNLHRIIILGVLLIVADKADIHKVGHRT